MTAREKLIELLRKAKSSMWGQSGLSCELARNSYIAEYLLSNGVRLELKQATSDKASDENKRWTPVTERLPEVDEQVLCRYVFGGHEDRPFYQVLDYYAFDPQPHFQHEGMNGMRVTHWMPLPAPPKEE